MGAWLAGRFPSLWEAGAYAASRTKGDPYLWAIRSRVHAARDVRVPNVLDSHGFLLGGGFIAAVHRRGATKGVALATSAVANAWGVAAGAADRQMPMVHVTGGSGR